MKSDKNNSVHGLHEFTDRCSSGTCPEVNVPILSCQKTRQLDRDIVGQLSMPSLLLMENAGRSLVDALKTYLAHSMEATFCVLPSAAGKWNPFREKRFLILCGKGNNGGDGFVVARRLLLLGAFVHVCTVVSGEEYTGDAAVQYRILKRLVDLASTSPAVPRQSDSSQAFGSLAMPAAKRLTIETFQSDRMSALFSRKSSENDFFWIIDALLGTGAAGALRSPYDQLVRWMNESDKPVFSVDLPSGLDADTGTCCGQAVHATLTCTLAVYKPGLFLPQAAPYVGTLVCGDIGVPLYD